MRKLSIFLFLTIVATLAAFAQKSETRQLSPFTRVTVHEGITAILSKGSSESAKVEATGVELSDVLTEVNGSTLKIHMKEGNFRNRNVTVYVTFREISGLHASSAGSIEVTDAITVNGNFSASASSAGSVRVDVTSAKDADLDVSSSGDIDIKIKANRITAELSSSGDIDISGSCNELEVDSSSAGDFDGYELVTKKADLDASSGSGIKVTVTDELDADASSGATIRYRGAPKYRNSDSSSGGSVRSSN